MKVTYGEISDGVNFDKFKANSSLKSSYSFSFSSIILVKVSLFSS